MTFIVRYTLPNIFKCEGKRFYPGHNEVTLEEWEAIKKHPLLQYRFDQGHLVWIDGKSPMDMERKAAEKAIQPGDEDGKGAPADAGEGDGDGQDEGDDNALAGCNVKTASEIVKETYDLNLLEKWKAKEERKSVVSAIDEQIKKITAPDQPEKK